MSETMPSENDCSPSSPLAKVFSRHTSRRPSRVLLVAQNRLVWSLSKVAHRLLEVFPLRSSCSKTFRLFLVMFVLLVVLVGTVVSFISSITWIYKHASCFSGEADQSSWTMPEMIPRPCPENQYPNALNLSQNDTGALLPHQICLVSLSDGAPTRDVTWSSLRQVPLWHRIMRCRNFDSIGSIVRANHESYANRHGYQYTLRETVDTTRPPAWSKILSVQEQFDKGCEWTMWIDADAVIMNSTIRVESLIDPAADLIVTPDTSFLVSSGVWLIKNSDWSKTLLERWWNMRGFVRQKGLSLSGDNQAFGHLIEKLLQDDAERRHIRVTTARCSMNAKGYFAKQPLANVLSRQGSLDHYHPGDFVAHAAGMDHKFLAIQYLIERAG